MRAQTYIDAICRAIAEGDADTLAALGQRLSEAEDAISILRAKGYGVQGQSLLDTARAVPNAKFWEE
ncbi:MAG TPA: hypothetical protein VGE56_00790 [Rhodocyclaceae bacterium]